MGSWALITGASAGIGRELAKVFAEHGHNLVLVARDAARLKTLADELSAGAGVETVVLAQDLAQTGAAAEIFAAVRERPISMLVNNAGFGAHGSFASLSLQHQIDMMQVNMSALVQLTHRFIQPMLAQRSGRILNVASTAAFQPGPTANIYYASKAFVYSFTYALAEELEGSGVTVTALCPGMTRTEFFERAQMRMSGWMAMDAREVAEIGYRGLMKGRRVVIPGWFNRVSSFFARRMPHRLTSMVVKRIH